MSKIFEKDSILKLNIAFLAGRNGKKLMEKISSYKNKRACNNINIDSKKKKAKERRNRGMIFDGTTVCVILEG